MLRRILVALDASERASGVLESAVELAQAAQATLFLLRVITVPPEFPAAATGNTPDRLPAYLAANAMQALLLLGEGTMQGTKIGSPIVRVGDPWRVILDTAEERDADLIVLGSHGYSGWDRVLGTTAGRVANLAHRNVLIVHSRGQEASAPRVVGSTPP